MTTGDEATTRIRELLLEASPAELRGAGSGEAARLVRDDPSARRMANQILEGQRALEAGLQALARTTGEGMVTGDAEGTGRSEGVPAHPSAIRPSPARTRPARRRWAWGAALTAAAGLAGALVWPMTRNGGLTSPGDPAGLASDAPPLTPPGIAVEAEGPFVVFPTRDPNITVVWLLPEEIQ